MEALTDFTPAGSCLPPYCDVCSIIYAILLIIMDSARAYWPKWTDNLRRHGLAELAAWVLEAAGPLNFLGAQALYFSQPFVAAASSHSLGALAHLLEQEDETRAFAALLKGKPQ